ncbi:MAG: hypothetical protein HRF47_12585 [Chloroflexota bacterium]|jgi:hypothetical protein
MLERPERLLIIAVFLLLFGCIMPFLMVTQAVPSTLLLNFLSFAASVSGLFLGIIGIAQYRIKNIKDDDERFHQ